MLSASLYWGIVSGEDLVMLGLLLCGGLASAMVLVRKFMGRPPQRAEPEPSESATVESAAIRSAALDLQAAVNALAEAEASPDAERTKAAGERLRKW